VLIVDWRSGAREIVDFIHLDEEGEGHVVAHELEPGVTMEMLDVALGAREQIVDAKHFVTLLEQAIDEMRPEEPGSAGHQNAFAAVIEAGHANVSLLLGLNRCVLHGEP
jgi:hypothetical protein